MGKRSADGGKGISALRCSPTGTIRPEVAQRATEEFGLPSPFTPQELAALAGLPFLGAEAVILLGLDDSKIAGRPALRKIGELLRRLEEAPEPERPR